MGKKRQRQFTKSILQLVSEGVGVGQTMSGQTRATTPWDVRAMAAAQGNSEVRSSGRPKSHRWWQSLSR